MMIFALLSKQPAYLGSSLLLFALSTEKHLLSFWWKS